MRPNYGALRPNSEMFITKPTRESLEACQGVCRSGARQLHLTLPSIRPSKKKKNSRGLLFPRNAPTDQAPVQHQVDFIHSMEVEAESIRVVTVSKPDSPTVGDFTSLSDALADAKPHTCIRILAGVYEEPPLMIDVDDMQIIAEGLVSIICRSLDAVLKLRSRRTLLKGLKLILVLADEVETDGLSCIVVEAGSVTMEDCQISGSAGGVLVMPAAPEDAPEPVFRSCHITECKDFAIKVMGGSNPHFDQCQIYNIKGFGIVACGDAR